MQVVGGIDSCFVSLPLSLIQTLQSTRSSPIPQILALELRSPTHPPHTWFVAWSGATSSSSSAIEVSIPFPLSPSHSLTRYQFQLTLLIVQVSPQFAECVSLPNHATVQVRAAPNVPHASLVTIEPHTEDDWEILELNADQAEAQILSQVWNGIRHSLNHITTQIDPNYT